MGVHSILSVVFCAAVAVSTGYGADEREPFDLLSEIRVRLRLNSIETSKLNEHYEKLVLRELSLQDNVRACAKHDDEKMPRLPQYQEALHDTQLELDMTRKRLVRLETERDKLLAQMKAKFGDPRPESAPETTQTLNKILKRLEAIEKQMQSPDRRK